MASRLIWENKHERFDDNKEKTSRFSGPAGDIRGAVALSLEAQVVVDNT